MIELDDSTQNNLVKFAHEYTVHFGSKNVAPFNSTYKKIIESENYLSLFNHFEMPEEYKNRKNQYYKKKIIKKIGLLLSSIFSY